MLEITTVQFRQFQTLIYQHCGIRLDDRKQLLLRTRLQRRLRQIAIEDVDKYLATITGPSGAEEFQSLIDVVTTNETSFFRTQAHFDWFSKQFLPEKISNQKAGDGPCRVSIWSAACSNGAEAYSLLFSLLDYQSKLGGFDVKILGSDLCTSALAQARAGKYPPRLVESMPTRFRRRFFDEVATVSSSGANVTREYQVRPEFRQRLEWVHHNLMHPLKRPAMDCIFLRNVLIYFDDDSKQTVLTNIVNQLTPGGYLVIGPSEGIYGLENPLKKINTFLYQKIIK